MELAKKCAVHDCNRPIWRNRSRFCGRHMNLHNAHGHPVAKAIPDREFNQRREWIDRGLVRYSNTKAYNAALRMADELLNYEPSHQFTVLLQMQRRLRILQGAGITPLDVVRRVCAYVAYIRLHPRPDQRSEDYGLARAVLRLAPLEGFRPQGRLLKFLGPEIRERLYVFANAFLDRLERDESERRARLADSADFNTQETRP